MDPNKFDWGSTRRVLMSVLTPLLAVVSAKVGHDLAPALDNTMAVLDAIVAASGPLYALVSNIRAILGDHHDAKVEVAKLAAAPGSLVEQSQVASQVKP